LQNNHRRFHDAQAGIPDLVSSLNTVSNPNPTALNNVYQTDINFSNPVATAVGYKNNYTMDVNVSYIPDNTSPFVFYNALTNPSPNTASNMKLITVNIKDNNGNLLTSLSSYSANIGEFDFAKRRF
jgi:flagellar basal body rod protein FlgC